MKAVRAASTSSTFSEGMEREKELFAGLMNGTQAKALQYFFFAERRVGKIPDLPPSTAPKPVHSTG